ncbi:putative secondary metabolism biosynthetic enzyme [Diaporthe australafricana]|uniref:Secondary metabolism biosynthetic enzyme n=1 Tax=Diaporthe australafricana TaxID=127596 RepID=A0ABR3XR30_9PEZI
MNFKDLLIAMGIVDTPALGAGAAAIGIETAGIVQAVGSAVTDFHPGERVMAVSIHCFASHVVTRQATCIAIPDELEFAKAATMPCVYATVIRALIDIGRTEKDQTVLVHSACGGVGIAAIQLCKMFGARDMFRFMQNGSHIGKIILEMADDPGSLIDQTLRTGSDICFKPEASYLITGGLGGLGKSTARWMVSKGAKSLIFLFRRGLTPSTITFFSELEAFGCSPGLVTGSVEDEATVKLAVTKSKFPVAGVVHGAMVLKDHATRNMPYSDWQTVMTPRVTGAWNLHHALSGSELDFFVLLGSFSGIVGQPGQANYAASNTFLNSFVQYRHGLGLPASALEMGPISDVGYVAESTAILESMKAMSTYAIGEQEYLDALQLAITRSLALPSDTKKAYTNPSVLGVGLRSTNPLDDPGTRLVWRRDIRLSIYRNLEKTSSIAGAASGSQNDVIKHLLALEHISDPSVVSKLASEIGRTLCEFLMRQEEDIALDKALSTLGVDSLVSIELRNWCRQHLSLEVSVLEIMQS